MKSYRDILLESVAVPGKLQPLPDHDKLLELGATERPLPGWNKAKVLKALGITEIANDLPLESGVHGYSDTTTIAVTRATAYPSRIVWHELGHVLCDHTARMKPGNPVAECEAELVAYILCHEYEYNEAKSESRAYVRHWRDQGTDVLKQISVSHIYAAVNKIKEASK